jgi:hypothetical protein
MIFALPRPCTRTSLPPYIASIGTRNRDSTGAGSMYSSVSESTSVSVFGFHTKRAQGFAPTRAVDAASSGHDARWRITAK